MTEPGEQFGEFLTALIVAITPLYLATFALFRALWRKGGNGRSGLNGKSLRNDIAHLREDVDSMDGAMENLRGSMESLRTELARAESWIRDLQRIESEVLRLRDRIHDHGNFIQRLEGRVTEIEELRR